MPHCALHTPIGDLTLREEDGRIVSLDWGGDAAPAETPLLSRASDLLKAYLAGYPPAFTDLPLAPTGTDFQKRVWTALRDIPAGQTETYGSLAKRLKTNPRAVGMACAANPIPIMIPCHRVVAANGSLGGYSGGAGLDTKAALLRLESRTAETPIA